MIELDPLNLPASVRHAVEDLEEEVEVEEYTTKGANGHLFFGCDRILERRLAVKFYYWAHGRAHDEPQRLAEVESDHITPVFTARFVNDEWAMFHTPYYPRGDLQQVVSHGALSLHQSINHTIETLVGVSALHAMRLVHRDLKPANIFIDDEGGARIGDFGSVRALPEGVEEVDGSGHSALYRPPESFIDGTYSKAGDLYQCGITLYQLLGGYLPYEQEAWLDRKGRRCWKNATDDFERSKCADEAIARRAARQRLLDLDTLPGTVYGALKTTIRRATRPEPQDRHDSTSQFIGELTKIRASCSDWAWDGSKATATVDDRDIRIVRESAAQYRIESNKGNGWRKLHGSDVGSVEDLAKSVDASLR